MELNLDGWIGFRQVERKKTQRFLLRVAGGSERL